MEFSKHALAPKQQLFCDEYLVDRNATAAAIRAGYSKETAKNGALMKLPKIASYLNEKLNEHADQLHINQEMVLRELAVIAFGNMGNYYGDDGEPKPFYMLTEDEKAGIAHIKTDNAGVLSIKMYNKLAALKEIAKLMRFYEPPTEQPKTVYVYLDKAQLDADDKFEDDSFDEEDKAREDAAAQQKAEDEYQFVDKDGQPLFENPLPYGPMAEVYRFDIHDKPDEMLAKLHVYESLQKPVAEFAAAHGGAEVFAPIDIRTQFANWLELELWKIGVGSSAHGDEKLHRNFGLLRKFTMSGNESGTLKRNLRYNEMPERLKILLPEYR